MKRTLTLATMIALGAAAFAPLPSMAQTDFRVVIGTAPPPPVYERIPAPRHGYVWAEGYWQWSGHRHHWVPGHWVAARPGYVYSSPNWRQRNGSWYMEPGQWTEYRGGGQGYYGNDRYAAQGYYDNRYDRGYRDHRGDRGRYRDSDRDGVPNRYDRDIDNDGVSNRYDRDRDGDGVRNERDARPDNPRRY